MIKELREIFKQDPLPYLQGSKHCRCCHLPLTAMTNHSHGFCIGCTDGSILTAMRLSEQYPSTIWPVK